MLAVGCTGEQIDGGADPAGSSVEDASSTNPDDGSVDLDRSARETPGRQFPDGGVADAVEGAVDAESRVRDSAVANARDAGTDEEIGDPDVLVDSSTDGDAGCETCSEEDTCSTDGSCDTGNCPDDTVSSPDACSTAEACTVATAVEVAGCGYECEYRTVTTCQDGDGCCPDACDATNDSDCSPVCGNGVVEGDETCDGDCPTESDCNNGDACTEDTLQGSASNCNAYCSHTDVTTCSDDDGCCPSGCYGTTDNDCALDCRDASTWPQEWKDKEEEVVRLVNQIRQAGATCGDTSYPPVPKIDMESRLREAARCHSMDMATNNFVSHQGSDGSWPSDRMRDAGYKFVQAGENVTAGTGATTAQDAVDNWMGSTGHCKNIMSDSWEETGVGFVYDADHLENYWTQKFGKE